MEDKILSLLNEYQNDSMDSITADEVLDRIADVLGFEYCRGHNLWNDGLCSYCEKYKED